MKFDLLTQPWIPVQSQSNARTSLISIQDLFEQAHLLKEIECQSPLETAAIIRVLLAILQQALSQAGSFGDREWASVWNAGRFPRAELDVYFKRFGDRFDLFHLDRPFMQSGGLVMMEKSPVTRLSMEEASGVNPTLFSHAVDSNPMPITPADAARRLLACQAFVIGFGNAGQAFIIPGEVPDPLLPTSGRLERPYTSDGISPRGATVFVSGANLFETLALNLVTGERPANDIPYWEEIDQLATVDRVINKQRVSVAARGIVDRYAWPSRMVRLLPVVENGQVVVKHLFITQGRAGDKSIGDAMKVFIPNKTDGFYSLPVNADKASWRDLQALLTRGSLGCPILAQIAARRAAGVISPSAVYSINVIGIATAPNRAAKVLLWRHDRLSLPSVILNDDALAATLDTALADVEYVGDELKRRIRNTVSHIVPPVGNPDPNAVNKLVDEVDPRRVFWARLEAGFGLFLSTLPSDAILALDTWRNTVEREATRALEESVESLGVGKQVMIAVAHLNFRFTANAEAAAQRKAELMASGKPKRGRKTTEKTAAKGKAKT